jgi:hypothetical protein
METATQILHRLTSYSADWEREWQEPSNPQLARFDVNDMERVPWFYKRYGEGLPRTALPRELPPTTAPVVAVLAGTARVPAAPLDLSQLGRLLHLAAGVVRTAEGRYGTFLFRAAGSAGGRFPLELYVAVPPGGELPPGVHCYDPREHALVEVGPPPVGGTPAVVVTGVPWRTGWRYRERGYRHVYWDAGTMLSQLLAAAESAGIAPALFTRFPDIAAAALVGADRVHEWPLAVVALGEGEPALAATGPAAAGDVDADPRELPLVTAAQGAGESDALGGPWPQPAVEVEAPETAPVEDVVLARSSQRRMDASGTLSRALLELSLAVALRGVDLPHYLVASAVDGLAAGVYRWPDLASPLRKGLLRDELYRVCLGQGLPRDAAFVVLGATHVAALDDRQYREANLAAGLVEGRLHLLAYALGASASGMTFIDADVPAFLGDQVDGLLVTCVGVPEYAPRRGGAPGSPVPIREVRARMDDG